MLDFEAALARAEAATGVIPAAAAASIVRCCRAENYDLAALRAAARNCGQSGDSPRGGADRAGGTDRRDRARLRPLGRDQPGRHRHRARAAAARRARSDRRRSRPICGDAGTAGARAPCDAARGSNLAAAGVAGDAGPEARRNAGRDRSTSAKNRFVALPYRPTSIRWRRRHLGVARDRAVWTSRLRSRPTSDSPSPTRRGIRSATTSAKWPQLLACDGDTGQTGARRVPARADRGRRSVRAGRAGTRRIVDHAAQAQPGRRRRRTRRRGSGAGPGRHHAQRSRAGARARPGRLARRMGHAAADRHAHRGCARRDDCHRCAVSMSTRSAWR